MNTESPVSAKILIFVLVILILTIGYIDYITGYDLGFFVLYFIPIAIASWMLGIRYAVFFSVVSAVVWVLTDWYSGHEYGHIFYYIWNAMIRLLSFLLIGLFLARIHILVKKEREISKNLSKAMNQVNTLSGLLPICAWCRRIRNDQGYWQQIEEYVKTHTDIEFSHGLCQECAAKMQEEEMRTATPESNIISEGQEKPESV